MKNVKSSIRDFVEFLYSSGDLTSDRFMNSSAKEGTITHQAYQKSKDFLFVEEVTSFQFDIMEYHFELQGRIDCISKKENTIVIEELKSTYQKTEGISEDNVRLDHLYQGIYYAYSYGKKEKLDQIIVRITYCEVNHPFSKSFDYPFTYEELEKEIMKGFQKYIEIQSLYDAYLIQSKKSIEILSFPFPEYRRGQRELMAYVYKNVINQEILYAQAPTGIGKTLAVLFSSLKAMTPGKDKIFYSTAKNTGKNIAMEGIRLLQENGLKSKAVVLTSKEEICFLKPESKKCDPEHCPYSKGFFDRIQDALKDAFMKDSFYDREFIEDYARKYSVCPFELSLDISNFCDIIICDYSYVFDPKAHLIRYFDENIAHPILLLDEAHNFVSRSRDMYTKELLDSDFVHLIKAARGNKPSIRKYAKDVEDSMRFYFEQFDKNVIYQEELPQYLLDKILQLLKKLETMLSSTEEIKNREELTEFYYKISDFYYLKDFYNEDFQFGREILKEDILYKIRCMDASKIVYDIITRCSAPTVFFSATLTPFSYFKSLFTCGEGETLRIQSPFPSNRLKIYVASDISTRYTERSQTLQDVVEILFQAISVKVGNYILFVPSYEYLLQILQHIRKDSRFDSIKIMEQFSEQSSLEKKLFLEDFTSKKDVSCLGLFVMGGAFSEGIDYIGDKLLGVFILGVGLPMVNQSNEDFKEFYEKKFQSGFEYAYRIPGMNKVIQSVGRVIRSKTDKGFAVLIDDRFTSYPYKKLFPMEWKNYQKIQAPYPTIKEELTKFYNRFEKEDEL